MVSLVALPRAKVVSSRSQKRVSSSFGSKTAVNSSSGSRALTSADECRKQLFAEETKRPEDHAEIVRPVAEKSHLQIFDDHGPYSTRSSSKVTWDTVGVRITPSKRPTIDIGIGVGKVHRTASSDGSVPLHGVLLRSRQGLERPLYFPRKLSGEPNEAVEVRQPDVLLAWLPPSCRRRNGRISLAFVQGPWRGTYPARWSASQSQSLRRHIGR